jgi:DnaJ homolog subfamily A member 5
MKEVDRLRREMEEDEGEFGLVENQGQEEQVGQQEVVERETPRSATPADVPADSEPPSPSVIPKDPQQSIKSENAMVGAGGRPQPQGRRTKRKDKPPNSPELPTKTEKKMKSRPTADITSPARENWAGVDVDALTSASGIVRDETEPAISKREKRRLREAKKAGEGHTNGNHVSLH